MVTKFILSPLTKGAISMKNYYSTIDNIVLTYSDIENVNDFDSIIVLFERANKNGFDFAEGRLPNNMFHKTYGFSEDELMELENYLQKNAFLIWEMAREADGVKSA